MKTNTIGRLREQGFEKLNASFRDGTFYESVRKSNLTPSGGATIEKTERGHGLYLPSSGSSYVNCGTTVYNPTDAVFSASCWVKQRSTSTNAVMMGQVAGGAAPPLGWMFYQTGTGFLSFWVHNYAIDRVLGTISLPLGIWTHIAGVSTSTDDILYVNGVFNATQAKGAGAYTHPVTNGLWLGCYSSTDDGTPDFYFDGYIDSPCMWSTALSATDVAQVCAETRPWG